MRLPAEEDRQKPEIPGSPADEIAILPRFPLIALIPKSGTQSSHH